MCHGGKRFCLLVGQFLVSSFGFRVSGWPFILTSQLETRNLPLSRPMAAILRLPPMSKIMLQRIALLETKQIIALPIPECNQEKQNSNSRRFALYLLPVGRVGQVRRVRHVRQWILGIGSISSYSTNDKAILYASHKPIQSLKMSHESHMSHKSHRQMVKCEAHNPPPESNLKTSCFP